MEKRSKQSHQRAASFYSTFSQKPGDQLATHYCPGCGHGNLHKLIAEAIDLLGIQDRTIFISPVGCSVYGYAYFEVGNIQVAHGRAPAVATALKRAHPESVVIGYQGDGDLAAIGGNEILHAANRGENLTIFFVNNAIYGMTGGQMAPTTLLGQKTTTTPEGRHFHGEGAPLRVSEMLASLEGPTYLERVGLFDNRSRMRARKAVRKALQNQIEGRGFSLVEVLSPCPTGYGLSPGEACAWVEEKLVPQFPLGVIKDLSASRAGWANQPRRETSSEELMEILGLGEQAEGEPPRRATPIPPRAEIKVAGFGGQGILFLGKVLAEAGMRDGAFVSWIPSYGPEMRGGTANCQVQLSDHPIGSPLVPHPSHLLVFNRPSFERFAPEVVPGGTLFYDCSLIDQPPPRTDLTTLAIPATALAMAAGSANVANVVMLGAVLRDTGLVERENVCSILDQLARNDAQRDLNRRALLAGEQALEEEGHVGQRSPSLPPRRLLDQQPE